jgi:outer membrane protein assembly factor BamB
VKWQYRTKGTIIGGPAIDRDETIYIGSMDSYFYAVNPNGSLKWKFKTDDCIKGPPSIGTDGTIYIGSYDGYLYALFPDGSLKWKCRIGYGTETNPSIGPDGAIFVGGEELYAVNPDGTLRWIFELQSNEIIFQSSPAISADGIIYVGTNIDETSGGDIIAVNPDGTLRWRHRIANEWVDSSPCIDENGIVYIGSSSITDTDPIRPHGFLYAFGPGDVNNPPDQPTIQGDTNGKIGETYTYTISGTDPDNDMISYFVDWDDGSDSGWQGPYDSGTSIELSHSWSEKDSYVIKAKAMDSEGSESNWATLQVSMPKNKIIQFSFSEWIHHYFSSFFLNCLNAEGR